MAKLLSIVSIIIGSLISLYVVALLIYGFWINNFEIDSLASVFHL
jgi:hypothetical protein